MAAARVTDEVLNMFYGDIGQVGNVPQSLHSKYVSNYDLFRISQTDLEDWLHVWRMDVSDQRGANRDLFRSAEQTRPKFIDWLQSQVRKLGSA